MMTKQQQLAKNGQETGLSKPKSSPLTTSLTNTRGKTRITVKYDVGFQNALFIRGHGANLSWDKGLPLKNVKADEWIWESDTPFTTAEFKVLLNDRVYETGQNHPLHYGTTIQYTPRFP